MGKCKTGLDVFLNLKVLKDGFVGLSGDCLDE
jgi:hypothetical protein